MTGRSLWIMGLGIGRAGGGGFSTLVAGGLPRATGLVVGDDGALYVSVNGASAGNGAVLRIVPNQTLRTGRSPPIEGLRPCLDEVLRAG